MQNCIKKSAQCRSQCREKPPPYCTASVARTCENARQASEERCLYSPLRNEVKLWNMRIKKIK